MPATAKLLAERWQTDDGRRRIEEVVRAARGGKDWAPILNGFPHADEVEHGRDLRRADLSGLDLRDAVLPGANLTRAELQGTDLRRAELTSANLSGANLVDANLRGADLAGANLSRAWLSRADLAGADLSWSGMSPANLHSAVLRGADLRRARLLRVNLTGASLIGAKLQGARFDRARLHEPDKWGTAHFADARFNRKTSFLGVDITRTDWSGNPLLRRHIQDQQWLHAWQNKSWLNRRLVYPLWHLSCDCGRSIGLWLFWSVLLVAYFGVIFWLCGSSLELAGRPGHTLADAPMSMAFYYSVATFTTLGFGDVVPRYEDALMQVCVACEVVVGYIMLAGLISIFVTKLSRRA